ncbi:Myb-like DNA-binding protein BAS1 [Astathelohania contejeani]|uniref:Myb-like DNA-binding protein BAS1 n=1 Tax=Astathelohania contejeani TaxID=164912 RepID=A0ABQ7I0I4_9MICR|nr:Myb-like DNA-binding protein BAS1 [Thelohania contejeani]
MRIDPQIEEVENFIKTHSVNTEYFKKYTQNLDVRFKHGYYTKKEIEIIKKYTDKFLKKNNLTQDNLNQYYFTYDETIFPLKELIVYLAKHLKVRTYRSIRWFVIAWMHPNKKREWSLEKELELMEAVNIHGLHWKKISVDLKESMLKCRLHYWDMIYGGSHWRFKIDNNVKNGLLEFYNEYATKNTKIDWNDLSKKAGVSVRSFKRHVQDHLSRLEYEINWNDKYEFKLIGLILKYNYACEIRIPFRRILKFSFDENRTCESINKEIESYNKIIETNYDNKDIDEIIVEDDIFWNNIGTEFKVNSKYLIPKFKIFCNIYSIKTYRDILKVFSIKMKEIIMTNYKELLINKEKNKEKIKGEEKNKSKKKEDSKDML